MGEAQKALPRLRRGKLLLLVGIGYLVARFSNFQFPSPAEALHRRADV